MPDTPEFEQMDVPDIVRRYENWLNKLSETSEGLTVRDLDNMFQVTYFRLRAIYTVAQMHQRLHELMAAGEFMLQQPGFLTDKQGNPTEPILRENFESTSDEEYHKMLEQQNVTISDEDLVTFLDEEE